MERKRSPGGGNGFSPPARFRRVKPRGRAARARSAAAGNDGACVLPRGDGRAVLRERGRRRQVPARVAATTAIGGSASAIRRSRPSRRRRQATRRARRVGTVRRHRSRRPPEPELCTQGRRSAPSAPRACGDGCRRRPGVDLVGGRPQRQRRLLGARCLPRVNRDPHRALGRVRARRRRTARRAESACRPTRPRPRGRPWSARATAGPSEGRRRASG